MIPSSPSKTLLMLPNQSKPMLPRFGPRNRGRRHFSEPASLARRPKHRRTNTDAVEDARVAYRCSGPQTRLAPRPPKQDKPGVPFPSRDGPAQATEVQISPRGPGEFYFACTGVKPPPVEALWEVGESSESGQRATGSNSPNREEILGRTPTQPWRAASAKSVLRQGLPRASL